jgi:hypothetical protein
VPQRPWVLQDHRIAAKNRLSPPPAAKWATVQVGGGRTVSELAAELACDWHTVNDALITYGEALPDADRNGSIGRRPSGWTRPRSCDYARRSTPTSPPPSPRRSFGACWWSRR